MTANVSPIYPLTPNTKSSTSSTAVTSLTLTGVGSATLGFTAGANGSRVDKVTIKWLATSTAGMLRIWKYEGSGNALLIHEEPVTAITASSTVASFEKEIFVNNWVLASGETLYWAPHNAEAVAMHFHGGDF